MKDRLHPYLTRAVALGAATCTLLLSQGALATNGDFMPGYGIKAEGRGGASIAFTTDAFGGASNPATMAFAGNRIEAGAELFMPHRHAQRTGTFGGAGDFDESSYRNYFIVPNVGITYQMDDRLTLGFDMYGNTGMDTNYAGNATSCGGPDPKGANPLCGQGALAIDLMEAVLAPTVAYKLTPQIAVGVSPLLSVQTFKARGLQAFAGMSNTPTNVTNKGRDVSYGYGVRVGILVQPAEWMDVGAYYSSKIWMTPFNRYKGLFANSGDFDTPENYGVGFVVKPSQKVRIGFDWQRIDYTGVKSVSNPSSIPLPLGSHGGPGFGWHAINVYKLGIEADVAPVLTLRFGYDHTTRPIYPQDVTFNILAPGVVQDHIAAGATYRITKRSELSFSYMYAVNTHVSGPTSPALPFGGREDISMFQNSFGLGYGFRF